MLGIQIILCSDLPEINPSHIHVFMLCIVSVLIHLALIEPNTLAQFVILDTVVASISAWTGRGTNLSAILLT